MAQLWPLSRQKEYDINGHAIVGARAFFYDAGTTTPQTIYSDAGLSSALDQPVRTDGYGRWPAVFLNQTPGTYHQLVRDNAGDYDDDAAGVQLFEDDNVSVPQNADFVPPDAGSTDATLLFSTGDIIARHGTGAHSGWVRAAGRTIGSATSGASERANADTSALFQHLWNSDSTLTVSTGRGANAAADFAANKTIVLPDYRSRGLVGLADMGNSASTALSGVTVDNSETVSTLGATLGAGTVTLDATQIPAHNHTATFDGNALPAHKHNVPNGGSPGGAAPANGNQTFANADTSSVSAGTPTGTVTVANSTGGGSAHANAQPSALVTFYIKL